MKHRIQLALALLSCSARLSANDVSSHTFFSTRPQNEPWTRLTDFLVVSHYHQNGRVLNEFTLEASVFGGKSGNWNGLRNYFQIGNLPSLTVAEGIPSPDSVGQNNAQNILSYNFNIQTLQGEQSSTINFTPKQTFAGAALSFRGPIRETWWYTIELPIIHVKNTLDLTETYSYTPFPVDQSVNGFYGPDGTQYLPVATMTEAFRQIGLQYGKVDGAQSKTRVADLTVRIGCDVINHVDMYLSPYGGVVFPTGNKPQAVYLFEPIVGNNHHYGLLGGLTSYVAFAEGNEGKAYIGASINARYLFANTQTRMIDLKGRPWSRYLAMYQDETHRLANQVTFGTNLLTQQVHVKPGFSADCDLIFSYVGDCYHVMLGVNTNMSSTEQVSLANPWVLGAQISSLTNASYVTPYRGIGNNLGPDVNQTVYITEADLDFISAMQPSYVSHTLYVDLGTQIVTDHPYTYNVGAAYEFAKTNAVMNRWTVFANLQLNF